MRVGYKFLVAQKNTRHYDPEYMFEDARLDVSGEDE